MKLRALAKAIKARIVSSAGAGNSEINSVFAGDKMSALLEKADASTLLVTSLANTQLARVAELMDCPGICLVDGVQPESALLQAASRGATAVLISPFDMFETCGRLFHCLYGEGSRQS